MSKKLPDGEIVPRRTFELGAFPTSGHLLSDLTNSLCAYVPGRPFDTSRFKISYAAVSLVSIADQSASKIAPLRASRNAIASALNTPASRSFRCHARRERSKPARSSHRKSGERWPLGELATSRVRPEPPPLCRAALTSRGQADQNIPQETATPRARRTARSAEKQVANFMDKPSDK